MNHHQPKRVNYRIETNLFAPLSFLLLSVLRLFQIFPKEVFVISSEMLTMEGSSLKTTQNCYYNIMQKKKKEMSFFLREVYNGQNCDAFCLLVMPFKWHLDNSLILQHHTVVLL